MDKEIKERIAAINSGIIPEGYKKTKVGIVPVEWEVTKLSEYLYVNKEKNTELKYSKNDVFSISGEYGIVNQIDFLGRSFAGVSVEPYRVVYPENIVYTKSPLKANPYGIIKSNQRKDIGIVSTLYAVYHCKENVLSKYVEYYFGLDVTLNNYLLPLVNIGSKHDMKISDENVLKGLVVFPPLPEQQKIAEILSTQDKLIELQEKKIEQLKELKKAYLQKMFPQKGSKYPELRFKGFTDPWEQRKVSDITSVASFKPYLSDANDDGEYEVIQQGDTPILGYADGKPFTEYEKTTLFGDHTLSLYKPKSPFFVASDGLKILYSEGMDGYFYYYLLEKYKPESEGYKRHFSILKECECSFPISKEEQEKIGAYFSQLDTLITLHQRKSEQEKQKKKALMQLLLTGIVRTK